ncbi:integral membrane protein [Dactylonectria estremocensis]|uniref:Integral membrane protein n=1 Tax=Dactylonectria estremocensis TaxID=1079267 RepID=A0A9P9ISA7_9HYPO|nr:integral membrane protein [Dactylonectria estremocensis]
MIYEDLHLVPKYAKLHGAEMGLAFVIIFPLGALFIRILKFKGSVWAHVACQLVGWVLMLAGLGTGIRLGNIIDRLHNNAHTIVGTITVVLMILQPIIGLIHHRQYRKKHTQTWWTHVHVWYGRVLIFLGIITGGLGLQLATNTTGGKILYGTIGGLVSLAYVAGIVYMRYELPRCSAKKTPDTEGVQLQNVTSI